MFKVCVSLILAIPTVIHDPSCISIDMFRHVYMGCWNRQQDVHGFDRGAGVISIALSGEASRVVEYAGAMSLALLHVAVDNMTNHNYHNSQGSEVALKLILVGSKLFLSNINLCEKYVGTSCSSASLLFCAFSFSTVLPGCRCHWLLVISPVILPSNMEADSPRTMGQWGYCE